MPAHMAQLSGGYPASLCTFPGVVCAENTLRATRNSLAVIAKEEYF